MSVLTSFPLKSERGEVAALVQKTKRIAFAYTLGGRVTWNAMKCAFADIRSRCIELTAATARIPIQTPKKPTVSAVSANHSKNARLLTVSHCCNTPRPKISAMDVVVDATSGSASDSEKEMGLVTAPACRQPAYCDNHRMQKACMCSLATLLNEYSAKTMRDCGESFLASIQGRLGTFALRRLRRSLAKCQAC